MPGDEIRLALGSPLFDQSSQPTLLSSLGQSKLPSTTLELILF